MTEGIVPTSATPGESSPRSSDGASLPKRIAFCITDLDVGGAERMLVELVTRLDRQRWDPKVFCLSKPGQLVERLAAANIPTVCFGATNARQWRVVWQLAKELQAFQPVLLQCFLFHANLAGRLAAKFAGVRQVVCGIRVAEKRSQIPLWLDRLTQRLVTHNVCVSRAVAEFSEREAKLHTTKISIIPNGVQFDTFANAASADRELLGIPADSPLILFVGRLDLQKAPFTLLEAFHRLVQRHPKWRVIFVGDGPLKESLSNWILERSLGDSVKLMGQRSDVPQLLKAANCLVLPSLWEGMPNIVLEAMASGLPVVVSRVEGTQELIAPNVTGLLCEPGSVSDFERQIEAVLSAPDFSNELANNAQRLIKERFTLDVMVAAYDQLYRRLLS